MTYINVIYWSLIRCTYNLKPEGSDFMSIAEVSCNKSWNENEKCKISINMNWPRKILEKPCYTYLA